jgi:formate dehydrogenase subunit delta
MVNQIAAFFEPYPEDEAVRGIAEHLEKFWEPRMRGQLAEIVANGGAGLSPLGLAGAKACGGEAS